MGVMYDGIVIHYAEIFLKGPSVKRKFEQILICRLQEKLKWKERLDLKISLKEHTILIKGPVDLTLVEYLAKTFGVRYALPVVFCKSSINSICEASSRLSVLAQNHNPLSFRVKPKKEKLLSLSSKTIEYEIASFFQHWPLDLNNPTCIIYAVIKKQYAYIGFHRVNGPGGLPYGSSGRVLVLISRGIDSTVAAWLMAMRGCELSLLHFGEEPVDKIKELLEQYSGKPIKVFLIPHKILLQKFQDREAEKHLCIFCKTAMYIAGEIIANNIKAQALVTGENLGQVASQTLDNMVSMTSMVDAVILRPLIALNKEEIIDLAKEIGSYLLYNNPSCPFVPKHPYTAMKKEKLHHYIHSSVFKQCISEWQASWNFQKTHNKKA